MKLEKSAEKILFAERASGKESLFVPWLSTWNGGLDAWKSVNHFPRHKVKAKNKLRDIESHSDLTELLKQFVMWYIKYLHYLSHY